MAHKDMENKIRHAFEAATPDVLDKVLRNCHEQKGTVIPMTNKKRKNWIPKVVAAAAMLVLVLGLGLGFGIYQENYKVVSTVSIDVNPSLEIHLNGKHRVVRVDALNEDGKIILGDKELSGKTLEEAMDDLLDTMIEKGYLNENANSVLVSVDSESEEKSNELKETVNKGVENSLKDKSFDGSVITQSVNKNDELQAKADANGISLSKAKLIERILAQDSRYTFEELAKLSINELNLITESGKLHLEDVTASGSASESKFVGKEAAKAAALTHAELTESDVLRMKVELDFENGTMVYEVEFHTAEYEYEYDINATTGEVIRSEKESHMERNEENKPVAPSEVDVITEEEAVSAALAHAGLETAENIECELEKDHGKFYYEIEFQVEGTEYDYLVDAVNGNVIRHQKEQEHHKAPTQTPEATPSVVDKETVKETVLAHAGVSEVTEYECELERDHNKLVYEIEFEANGTEYEYTVDAVSGGIIRFDKEAEDHYVEAFRPQAPAVKPTQNATVPSQPDHNQNAPVQPNDDHNAPEQPNDDHHTESTRPIYDGNGNQAPTQQPSGSVEHEGTHIAPTTEAHEPRPTQSIFPMEHWDEDDD